MSDQITQDFWDQYGEDTYTRIWQAACGDVPDPGVVIEDTIRHSPISHVYRGYVVVAGVNVYFEHYSNNNVGDGLSGFGLDPVPQEPEERKVYQFVPADPFYQGKHLVEMKFAAISSQPDFKEMERAMNYDYHFAPGLVTERHYTAWAAERGLRITVRYVPV